MTTRETLISTLALTGDVSVRKAGLQFDALFAGIAAELAASGEVRIAGFGTFRAKERPAYPGRNPQTGEPLEIAAKCAVKFKAAKTLEDKLNPTPEAARRRA